MSTLLSTIQDIAVKAVNSTNPVVFTFGTVTSDNPLKIRIDSSTIEIGMDSLILTANVVEKTIEIDKHTHGWGDNLSTHVHTYSGTGGPITGAPCKRSQEPYIDPVVDETVLSARCIEHGETRNGDAGSDKIVVTVTRALQKNDRVIMLRVCSGQEWIILSRVYD